MSRMFLSALSFLTLLPFRVRGIDIHEIHKSVIFFPLIGAMEGALCVVLAFVLMPVFSPTLISILCLLFLFLIRGIFHIDGLSDTADALFFKETGDREKDIEQKLQIMKDSTVGVGGVTVVVLDILIKFALIKELLENQKVLMPLILTFCLSRWILIPLMYHGKPARQTGLGALFAGKITVKELILSTMLPVFLTVYFAIKNNFIFLPFLIIFLYILSIEFKRFFEKKFNGLTGDNLGATVEVSEIILLFIFTVLKSCYHGG